MDDACSVEVLWIPLGAGQHVVRWSGLAFEAVAARWGRRDRFDLYHSALIVRTGTGRVVVEMTPVPRGADGSRGVVGTGAVGIGAAGRLRVFRYEIRRWPGGEIPDEADAVAALRVPVSCDDARVVLDLVAEVPTPVWGRDSLRAGEMWNSNSVTSWLLERSGLDAAALGPPAGGRAPGWDAGVVVARRVGHRITAGDRGEGAAVS